MVKCDIIIPIYNAYDCLKPCIDSIIKNTDLKDNKIILIDDNSPDARVLPLLEEYTKLNKSIILLKNEKNLGFVGTVNKGMKYSKNDVLLLNSDTEVSIDWLNNIKETAYSQPMVASVTALSNNATLASVPIGLQPNDLPSNMTFDEYANMVSQIAYPDTFELPTAHGFCMYIRREALDTIGYFDEETFGKGYGEENDFSFRALDYGFKNLLCTKTIVYHKESKSFSDRREKLVEEHGKILEERYPVYNKRVELWCKSFPIKKVCENIDYQIQMHNRKNILMIIHDFTLEHLGGTTMHVVDVIKANRDKYNFHVLAPNNGMYKVYSFFEKNEKITELRAINNSGLISYYNSDYKDMLDEVVVGFRINTIHVHHMINHYFDIIDVAKQHNIKSIITLHDLYAICPTINMLYKMEEYCMPLKDKNCSECIYMKTGLRNNILPTWQREWQEYLHKFDQVIVPSNNTKDIIGSVYKDLKIDVIPHGIEYKNNKYLSDITDKDVIDVAFVGVVSIHKGGNILKKLIKNKNSRIRYHLFGSSELPELNKNQRNFINHGKYERDKLPQLLRENNINLVCLLSIWPETYSYTLTESIAAGIPVLAFDLGAIGDRIQENKYGWVIDSKSSTKNIVTEIISILDNKEEYANVMNIIKNYHIKTIDEMGEDYNKIYVKDSLIKLDDKNSRVLKCIIERSNNTGETVNSMEAQWILNSLRWKIVSKIKVPNFIKKIIKKVARR